MKTPEEYMDHVRTLDPKYHWVVPQLEKGLAARESILVDFPYGMVIEDHTTDMRDHHAWLVSRIGHHDGECCWDECCDAPLDRPEIDKLLEEWGDKHREWLEEEQPLTLDHSHVGVWRSHWGAKTGYDFGYQYYFFKTEYARWLFSRYLGDSKVSFAHFPPPVSPDTPSAEERG